MSKKNDTSMFLGASPYTFEKAKELRKSQTVSEKRLWKYLNNNQLGVKFRRQHPLSIYIVDFYCHKLKLVIEVDGGYHLDKEQKNQDDIRTRELEQLGLKVIRFTNEEIFENSNGIIDRLKRIMASINPDP